MVQKQSPIDRVKQQLRDKDLEFEQIDAESTASKKKKNRAEVAELQEMLASLERVESRARHTIPPSAEETAIWTQIKELMEMQAGILHKIQVPEKRIRPDAIEFALGDLQERRKKLQAWYASLRGNQSAGARYIAEKNALDEEESNFNTRLKPVCLAGIRLFEIRQKIATLSAKRDELKAAREAAGLATV